eukprot:2843557-Rhodomonas_salina.5
MPQFRRKKKATHTLHGLNKRDSSPENARGGGEGQRKNIAAALRMVLCICYAMSGTDVDIMCIVLCSCYAISCTACRIRVSCYAFAMRCPVGNRAHWVAWRPGLGTSGICYARATKCPVLTWCKVLPSTSSTYAKSGKGLLCVVFLFSGTEIARGGYRHLDKVYRIATRGNRSADLSAYGPARQCPVRILRVVLCLVLT